jgi:RecB family endonuclease NucS
VIRKFKDMIDRDVPEKPDMQEFLFEHPWLIDPEFLIVEHEKALETLIVQHFKLDPKADPESDTRIDFFCISTRGRYLVVEVKRPGKTIGEKEIQQILNYVAYLRRQAPTSGLEQRPNYYQGVLVGHHVSSDTGESWRQIAADSGVTVRSWPEMLDVAERIHREFLAQMKERAPQDSRIRSLPPIEDGPPPREAGLEKK